MNQFVEIKGIGDNYKCIDQISEDHLNSNSVALISHPGWLRLSVANKLKHRYYFESVMRETMRILTGGKHFNLTKERKNLLMKSFYARGGPETFFRLRDEILQEKLILKLSEANIPTILTIPCEDPLDKFICREDPLESFREYIKSLSQLDNIYLAPTFRNNGIIPFDNSLISESSYSDLINHFKSSILDPSVSSLCGRLSQGNWNDILIAGNHLDGCLNLSMSYFIDPNKKRKFRVLEKYCSSSAEDKKFDLSHSKLNDLWAASSKYYFKNIREDSIDDLCDLLLPKLDLDSISASFKSTQSEVYSISKHFYGKNLINMSLDSREIEDIINSY